MGLFSWLFSQKKQRTNATIELDVDEFDLHVVGESYYQENISKLVGGKTERGVNEEFDAHLVPEDGNTHDRNAVAVHIEGLKVGHLSRDHALMYRKKLGNAVGACEALVRGGWDRGEGNRGDFGVSLNAVWPPRALHD
jgi:hypothetical protein